MKLYVIDNPESRRIEQSKKKFILESEFSKINIPITRKLSEDEFNMVDAVKKGFHIISVAFIGMTYFSSICQDCFSINQTQQELFITPINSNKETGSLYPNYSLTILPYRYRTNAFTTLESYDYTNGNGYTIEEIKVHIKDAFKSEIDYVKSGKLVFDLRDLDSDMFRYRNIIHGFVSDEYKDFDWEIFIY